MMPFKTVSDLLRFAIAKEQSSVRFYRALAEHAKESETAAVFTVMARLEEQHVATIRLELMKLGHTIDVDDSSHDDSIDESDDQDASDIDENIARMSYVEALRLGIQKEQASFILYAEMMTSVEDLAMQTVFLELAKEEMRHLIQLEHDVEILSGHHGR